MSENLTLARPYARAAFELARGAGALPAWGDKLAFSAAVAADPRVANLLGDPRLDEAGKIGLLLPEGEPAGSAYAGFLGELSANGRLRLLAEIAELYGQQRREHEQVLRVRVRAAVPLEAAQAESLKAALKKRFGRDIELHSEIDTRLIGGAVIDAGDVVIDGSVRGRLARLERALTQ